MRVQHIETMEWDNAVQGVLQNWWNRVLSFPTELDFIRAHNCINVHDYLIQKVHHIVRTKNHIGQPGLAFYYNNDPGQCLPCLVWADGSHNQETPLGLPQPNEQWWPCICLNINPNAYGLIPFYCPALGWSQSRPWWVHISRVRRIVRRSPQQEPLQPRPAPPLGSPTTATSVASSTSTSTCTTTSSSSESESVLSSSSDYNRCEVELRQMD